jgi:hypothetical protein
MVNYLVSTEEVVYFVTTTMSVEGVVSAVVIEGTLLKLQWMKIMRGVGVGCRMGFWMRRWRNDCWPSDDPPPHSE